MAKETSHKQHFSQQVTNNKTFPILGEENVLEDSSSQCEETKGILVRASRSVGSACAKATACSLVRAVGATFKPCQPLSQSQSPHILEPSHVECPLSPYAEALA
jgi:hypothetical protein